MDPRPVLGGRSCLAASMGVMPTIPGSTFVSVLPTTTQEPCDSPIATVATVMDHASGHQREAISPLVRRWGSGADHRLIDVPTFPAELGATLTAWSRSTLPTSPPEQSTYMSCDRSRCFSPRDVRSSGRDSVYKRVEMRHSPPPRSASQPRGHGLADDAVDTARTTRCRASRIRTRCSGDGHRRYRRRWESRHRPGAPGPSCMPGGDNGPSSPCWRGWRGTGCRCTWSGVRAVTRLRQHRTCQTVLA